MTKYERKEYRKAVRDSLTPEENAARIWDKSTHWLRFNTAMLSNMFGLGGATPAPRPVSFGRETSGYSAGANGWRPGDLDPQRRKMNGGYDQNMQWLNGPRPNQNQQAAQQLSQPQYNQQMIQRQPNQNNNQQSQQMLMQRLQQDPSPQNQQQVMAELLRLATAQGTNPALMVQGAPVGLNGMNGLQAQLPPQPNLGVNTQLFG